MSETDIKAELQRITIDLRHLLAIVKEDCQKEHGERYHVGVMVGLQYVKKEIEQLFDGLSQKK